MIYRRWSVRQWVSVAESRAGLPRHRTGVCLVFANAGVYGVSEAVLWTVKGVLSEIR